jgi:hypothetical protein
MGLKLNTTIAILNGAEAEQAIDSLNAAEAEQSSC